MPFMFHVTIRILIKKKCSDAARMEISHSAQPGSKREAIKETSGSGWFALSIFFLRFSTIICLISCPCWVS